MSTPRIAVLIPAFNASWCLPQAIASVAAQTRRPTELIVIDDHSTDATAELARSLGARVLSTATNAGCGAARVVGGRQADAEYLAFLDADDIWEPWHLETVAGLLDAHPSAVLACARGTYFGGRTGDVACEAMPEGTPSDLHALLMTGRSPVIVSSVVVRRSPFVEVCGIDDGIRWCEDIHMWLQLAQVGGAIRAPRATVRYRVHGAQMTVRQARIGEGLLRVLEREYRRMLSVGDKRSAAVKKGLSQLLNEHFRHAFHTGDEAYFDTCLHTARLVDESARRSASWERKRPVLRLVRAWRSLPMGWQERLRLPILLGKRAAGIP